MRRTMTAWLLACAALAGCEKPPLIRYPGEAPAAVLRNTAPVVRAGSALDIQWPSDSVQLDASVTDDGLPESGKLRSTWSSHTPGVTFTNPLATNTTARFPAHGTYVLELTADDGALQASDTVIVTVRPAAANVAPTVDAGIDQTVELPFEATLQGAVTDDGLPATALDVQWSVLSGPGAVTFENAASARTAALFTAPGTYELQLAASDGNLTGTDATVVTVQPAVYPAADVSDEDPDRGWTRVPPADAGMDEALLQAAERYALQAGGAGLIIRKGRLVHSWGPIDRRWDLKSTTKSIGAIALALAMDDNRVRLADLAVTHLPGFGQPPVTNDPAQLSRITLLQLATHTAGFEKPGGYGRLVAAPGTQWLYSDGGLNWLADILTNVYAQDLAELFISRVWPVLGINERDDVHWRLSVNGMRPDPRPNGIEHREFAAGIIANVNAMARVGLLYLRRGEWANGQRLFSASFTDVVRTPTAQAAAARLAEPLDFPEANLRYGVLWWTNTTGALPQVPRDAYWAWGLGDSLIVVIPSLDLVIARAGDLQPPSPDARIFGDDDWNGDYSVLEPFLDPIVQSVVASD